MKKNVFLKAGILLLSLLLLPGLSGCGAISGRMATPTPTMPGEVMRIGVPLQVDSISSIAGEGEVSFTSGDEPGSLRANIRGEIPIIDGESCDFCLATIRIAPNLRVPLPLLYQGDVPSGISGGGIILPLPVEEIGITGSISRIPNTSIELVLDLAGSAIRNPDSYILAGPSGAVLKKDADTFTLIEGEASIVR